jgi:hypothetical protein
MFWLLSWRSALNSASPFEFHFATVGCESLRQGYVIDMLGDNIRMGHKEMGLYDMFRLLFVEGIDVVHVKIQSVPRSKHTPSQLYKPVS